MSDQVRKEIRSAAMWTVIYVAVGVWCLYDYGQDGRLFDAVLAPIAFMMAGAHCVIGIIRQKTLPHVEAVEQSIAALTEMLDEQRKEKDDN